MRLPCGRMIAAVVLGLGILASFGARPQDAVIVLKSPATSATRPYDPHHIPPQMPPTIPGEAGVTVSRFGCVALLNGTVIDQYPNGNQTHVTVRVDSAKISLKLHIVEWVSEAAGSKIRAHEDGHRIISEHFYSTAQEVAQTLGREIIGRLTQADGADAETAAQAALKQSARELADQYMAQVRDRSQQVQVAYDRITKHGTNDVDEMDAIEQAMREVAGRDQ